jgi:hypothetical protein
VIGERGEELPGYAGEETVKIRLGSLALVMGLFPLTAHFSPLAAQGARAFTPADWYRVTTVSSPAVSPDGKQVAFTVTTVVAAENKRHAEVWMVPAQGGEPIGSPPWAGTIQTSACRLFSAATTVVTVKATCFPSGDTAGELTVVTRYQSAGVKARAPWAARGEK